MAASKVNEYRKRLFMVGHTCQEILLFHLERLTSKQVFEDRVTKRLDLTNCLPLSSCPLFRSDSQRRKEINHGDDRTQKKYILITPFNPDKTANNRDADGKKVINSHAHRQRLGDIFRYYRYFLQICRPRHTHRHQHLIDNITDESNKHRCRFSKYNSCETITNTDENKNYRLRGQNKSFPQLIDCFSQHGFEKYADDSADSQKNCENLRFLPEHCHQYPGSEGQKYLFARSIKDIQPIKQFVLLTQLKFCFRRIRPILLHHKY